MDRNGIGMCNNPYPGLNDKKACYVKTPSTCSDLLEVPSEGHLSAKACLEIDRKYIMI